MKKIFYILAAIVGVPMALFGFGLMIFDIIDFYHAIAEGRPLVFVSPTDMLVLLLMGLAVFLIAAIFVIGFIQKIFITADKQDIFYRRAWRGMGVIAIVWSCVIFASIFYADNYLRITAIEKGYIYCAEYHGRNREGDIIFFTKTAEDCQTYADSGLNVKEYRQKMKYAPMWDKEEGAAE